MKSADLSSKVSAEVSPFASSSSIKAFLSLGERGGEKISDPEAEDCRNCGGAAKLSFRIIRTSPDDEVCMDVGDAFTVGDLDDESFRDATAPAVILSTRTPVELRGRGDGGTATTRVPSLSRVSHLPAERKQGISVSSSPSSGCCL